MKIREPQNEKKPIVGILLRNKQLSRIQKRVFDRNIAEYIKANKKVSCFLYFFSSKTVDIKNDVISGYSYNYEKGDWIYDNMPMPDVIYDLGVRLEEDEINSVNTVRQKLRYKYNIQFINNCFQLDKWSTYEKLSKNMDAKEYLPETIVYREFDNVKDMIKKFDFIFLKSIDGCSGKQVLSIRSNKGNYEIDYYDKVLKKIQITDLDKLKKLVENFIGKNIFIIQQGIQLIKYNGKIMDLRIVIQKNILGKWDVQYYGTRIAKDQSTITNYSAGGQWTYLDIIYDDLSKAYKDVKLPLIKDLGEQTIKIADAIEKEFGTFGEIGMDMAIDNKGRLWFIEANATPDKTPIIDYNTEKILPYFASILEYAIYLAKHKKNSLNK